MKKYLISGIFVLAVVAYISYQQLTKPKPAINALTGQIATASPTPTTVSPTGTATPTVTTVGTTTAVAVTPSPASSGQYKDGTYTGSVADAFYGNIQVEAVISGGKITDVKFLQYPNDRGESIQVNDRAMPLLTSEAIKAQSANVDVVSGATQSSEAFAQSLSAALSQAKS